MTHTSRRSLLTLWAVGLLLAAPCELSARPVPTDKVTRLLAPRMPKPPTIDGRIGPAEWRHAAAIGGVAEQASNSLLPRPTTFYLAWDAGHVYLACRTWVMPNYKPRVSGRAPGSASVGDDGLELHFKPEGKNVPAGRPDSSYKFFVNCLGFGGEFGRVSVGQMFRNWSPKLRTAVGLTKPGTAPRGGRWWELELSAPADQFELNGPNRLGDRWRVMLGFNHMPIWIQARVPCNSGYFDPTGFPEVVLADNVPCVQVTMEDLPGACDGMASATVRAYNPTGQPVKLDALVQYADKEGDLLKHQEPLTVGPG